MRTCLEVMDYHKPIFKIGVVSPSHTNSAGDYVPEISGSEPIKGHWEDITYEMINRAPEGMYNVGDRMFYSGSNLNPLDKLLIEELDGGITRWEVLGREQKLPYWDKIGVRRYSYHLKRIQDEAEYVSPFDTVESPVVQATVSEPITVPDKNPEPVVAPAPVVTPPVSDDPVIPEPEWTPTWMKKKGVR